MTTSPTGSPASPAPPAPSTGAPGVAAASAPPPPPRDRWIRGGEAARFDAIHADRWTVRGLAKVTGEVDATTVEIEGALSVGGALRAGTFSVRGPVEVVGPARLGALAKVHGAARFFQSLDAEALDVQGSLTVQGPMAVTGLARCAGDVNLAGAVRCGRLVIDGHLEAPGEVRADTVALNVTEDSSIGTLRATSVLVTRPSALPFKLPLIGKERPTLTVLRVEASEVRLEAVSVEILRADRIVLGPGCHVARAIGEIVSVDPTSHVGPESRSPPPHGIHR